MSRLRFGPVPADALVICVDMQRVFIEPGHWHCPQAVEILPNVARLVTARPQQSLFTRFISAHTPEDAVGAWRRYYHHWRDVTLSRLGRAPYELHPGLAAVAQPGNVFDKSTYDAFDTPEFAAAVADRAPGALVMCGLETEVCVLATVMSAVDLGYRVVLARDALTSGDPNTHDACLQLLDSRFNLQVELADTDEILERWDTP
ncbi:isochorismatase family cysteine hydrolase [Microbaculum marinum]|uniref:Isochorismatase family cysteine hydrolase n=1 Tax=Microbaculum marinum TaxID=1764581 RepID=A0AAW9RKA9_9HYPH